jgi:Mannosylglycerate hydrolase MGH1-like glycoside hydrolase domain
MRFPRRLFPSSAMAFTAALTASAKAATKEGAALRDALVQEAAQPGKATWRPMLLYLAELHGNSVHPPLAHFPFPFEDIGPGYQGGTTFGHIDLTHERLDTVRALPEHARNQTRNELAGQQADGLIPGVINFDPSGKASWKDFKGFPPLWPVSVEAYVDATSDVDFLRECLAALRRQIGWFESRRAAPGGGFYYLDVVQPTWESGMDEGIRYDQRPLAPAACVDACSHLYLLYDHAARWSQKLGQPADDWHDKARGLQQFIQKELWEPDSGFFYDAWTVRRADLRHLAFEGMWPVVVGAATREQAVRVIDEHLLNPKEFFAPHPITTVALSDPKFELRMWRGPAWNCMTFWAARGCMRYGRETAAGKLLEAALDATASQFERTGTIWEFYHPQIGDQQALERKPKGRRIPCRDYLGHNPLFAMTDLWRKCGASTGK